MLSRRLLAAGLIPCLCAASAFGSQLFRVDTQAARPATAAPPQAVSHSLEGTWRLVADRGTDPSPWTAIDLTIRVQGPRVTLARQYANGLRSVGTVERLDLSLPVTVVPVPFWAENRNLGANISGDRTERVRARWLDGDRILRTDADLVLGTQQGDRKVNILTDYKISNSGAELTVIELRSTREIPIVYVFKRISS